jgi:hypothetical protein
MMLTNYFTHQCPNQVACTENIFLGKRFLGHLKAFILEKISLKPNQ